MNKNIIWIFIIGFGFGFISREHISSNDWLFIFSPTKGNSSFWEMINAISSLFVPIALAVWAWYSENQKDKKDKKIEENENQKDKKDKRTEDKEYILSYIEKELKPFPLLDEYEIERTKNEEIKYKLALKSWLIKCSTALEPLIHTTNISSYSYMIKYFELLAKLTFTIVQHNNLSTLNLLICHSGFFTNINYIKYFLLLDETQYQEEVLRSMNCFVIYEDKIRTITLEVLKDYPQYEKAVLKKIEDIDIAVAENKSKQQ
ncbi:MAG: hypothetical protein KFW21_01005 [Spirochaetota bacterium]|nr:hypothetical protein [Spirochaetota bacterium]